MMQTSSRATEGIQLAETLDNSSIKVNIIQLQAPHFGEVITIENASFDVPWGGEEFKEMMMKKTTMGHVAIYNKQVVGYIIYKLYKKRLEILNLAVDPIHRRRRVGTQLVNEMHKKLSGVRKDCLAEVRDSNLVAQLFYKANGYLAVEIMHNHYDNVDDDAYLFKMTI